MINFGDKKKHERAQCKMTRNSWSSMHLLIVGYSGSEETNVLLNVISHQPDIGKNYL